MDIILLRRSCYFEKALQSMVIEYRKTLAWLFPLNIGVFPKFMMVNKLFSCLLMKIITFDGSWMGQKDWSF